MYQDVNEITYLTSGQVPFRLDSGAGIAKGLSEGIVRGHLSARGIGLRIAATPSGLYDHGALDCTLCSLPKCSVASVKEGLVKTDGLWLSTVVLDKNSDTLREAVST